MVVQINVERHEVEEGEIEILRGGITGVGDQAVGVGLLDHVPQLLEEARDAPRAVPADDIGRDLVADVVGQDAGVMLDRLRPPGGRRDAHRPGLGDSGGSRREWARGCP